MEIEGDFVEILLKFKQQKEEKSNEQNTGKDEKVSK
jgi:hypothetical protein